MARAEARGPRLGERPSLASSHAPLGESGGRAEGGESGGRAGGRKSGGRAGGRDGASAKGDREEGRRI